MTKKYKKRIKKEIEMYKKVFVDGGAFAVLRRSPLFKDLLEVKPKYNFKSDPGIVAWAIYWNQRYIKEIKK